VFVDELGLLIGPAVFCCQRLRVRQKTHRSFWSYDEVGKAGSTTVSHRSPWTRGTRRHLVGRNNVWDLCCEISTLEPFISIACFQLAFPHGLWSLFKCELLSIYISVKFLHCSNYCQCYPFTHRIILFSWYQLFAGIQQRVLNPFMYLVIS